MEKGKIKRIGDYLVHLGFVTEYQVEEAFRAQQDGKFPEKRLGDILMLWNLISRSQLDKAIESQMMDQFGMA
jgi:hypothetical protein